MATSSSRGGSRSDQERSGRSEGEERGNGGGEARERRRAFEQPMRPSFVEMYARLQERLQEHPYQTLAVVAGVGFILGGGLFTRLAGNMIGTAVRLGIAGAITPLLDEIAAMAGSGGDPRTG